MLRRVNLAILFALIVGLSFGLSAAAAPGDGPAREDEVGQARERLGQLEMEADMAGQSHANAVFQLGRLDEEIEKKAEDLKAVEEELAAAEEDLQERAAEMYKSGNVGFVDVLVGAEDFSEFANRLELWMRLVIQEKDEFERVRVARDELAQKKADLEEKRRQRAATVEEAEAQKNKTAGLEADAQAYLDSLKAEVREAMEAEQARQAQLAKQEGEKLRAEIAKAEPQAVRGSLAPPPAPALGDEEEAAPLVPESQEEPAIVPARDTTLQQALADRRAEREAAEAYAAEKAAEAEQARRDAELAEAADEAEALLAAAQAAEEQAALAEERAAARAAEEEEARQAAEQQYAEDQAAAAQDQYEGNGQYGSPQGGVTTPGGTTSGGDQYGASDDQYGNGSSTGAAGAQPSQPSVGAGGGTASGSAVVAEAAKYFGTPYVLGGPEVCVPYETMDCSCFTLTAYAAFGISLPDSPGGQMGYGTPVQGPPQAGDLLFWSEDGSGNITHVGIATGNGTTVHASVFAGYATETPIEYIDGYVGARRLL